MADYSQALTAGLVLLFLFGGILPLILSPFAVDVNSYEGYLSPIVNFVQSGIQISVPSFFFSADLFSFNFNPFSWLGGNFQTFLVTQLNGFALIPAVIGIPIIFITSGLLLYGLIKLLPFG